MRRHAAHLARSCCRPSANVEHAAATLRNTFSRRGIKISSMPAYTSPAIEDESTTTINPPSTPESPDARFETLGPTASILSVSLSASQNLYTRRGTLVGVTGSPEHTLSTLSPLSPVYRLFLGIPFLYQKLVSASPISLLIAARGAQTSFSIIHLDGRQDWKITQRNALVAYTGHTLLVKPEVNRHMNLAYWGNTSLTGRGLVALAAQGQVFQVVLKTGEQLVLHPSNVVAYSVNANPPEPYRFRSTTLRLTVPNLGKYMPDTQFWHNIRKSYTYKLLGEAAFRVRTWLRASIWGDRLFIRFHGPTTLLMQSRGSSLRESLSNREVNEIADSPAGSLEQARSNASLATAAAAESKSSRPAEQPRQSVTYANITRDGKVEFSKQQ